MSKIDPKIFHINSKRTCRLWVGIPSSIIIIYLDETKCANFFYFNSHDVRKSVARVATVISQTQRDQLRLYYKGKKYLPIDLRAKKTRAIRRKLSASEAGAKTLRQQKKDMHFPMRKYAIRA